MLFHELDIDEHDGASVTERELHMAELKGDNVPKMLGEMDDINLQLSSKPCTIPDETRECLFTRQIEKGTQLKELYQMYTENIQKNVHVRSFHHLLRSEIDTFLKIKKRMSNRKRLLSGAAAVMRTVPKVVGHRRKEAQMAFASSSWTMARARGPHALIYIRSEAKASAKQAR